MGRVIDVPAFVFRLLCVRFISVNTLGVFWGDAFCLCHCVNMCVLFFHSLKSPAGSSGLCGCRWPSSAAVDEQ